MEVKLSASSLAMPIKIGNRLSGTMSDQDLTTFPSAKIAIVMGIIVVIFDNSDLS